MVSDHLRSPNAIPPRTSSSANRNSFQTPTKSVLKPLDESDWIAHSKKLHTTSQPSSPPGMDPPKSLGNHSSTNGTTWSREKEKIVLGPYDYMYDHPGKDIRKQLVAAFNVWLQVPEESLVIITRAVGMLHTASLLWVSKIESILAMGAE